MTEIICEIGKNFIVTEHGDEFELARVFTMIDIAKECGITTVKFQIHDVKDEIHPNTNLVSPHFNKGRFDWIERNTYPVEFWWRIKEYCREHDVEFLATPMSKNAAMMLNEDLGVDRWKIGSGDILDFVMLDYIRDTGKPVILSSGMSSFEELQKAYDYLTEKTKDITILHCVSIYPCPLESLNLATIPFLQKKFPKAQIGFSDHSVTVEGSLMAVSLGAKVIEKHFTMDREAWGPDHKVSLLPHEMRLLVEKIRANDLMEPSAEAYGVVTKTLQQGEMGFRPVFRKGLYAARSIRRGELFEPDSFYAMRPKLPEAMPSEQYPEIVGKVALRDYAEYDIIENT